MEKQNSQGLLKWGNDYSQMREFSKTPISSSISQQIYNSPARTLKSKIKSHKPLSSYQKMLVEHQRQLNDPKSPLYLLKSNYYRNNFARDSIELRQYGLHHGLTKFVISSLIEEIPPKNLQKHATSLSPERQRTVADVTDPNKFKYKTLHSTQNMHNISNKNYKNLMLLRNTQNQQQNPYQNIQEKQEMLPYHNQFHDHLKKSYNHFINSFTEIKPNLNRKQGQTAYVLKTQDVLFKKLNLNMKFENKNPKLRSRNQPLIQTHSHQPFSFQNQKANVFSGFKSMNQIEKKSFGTFMQQKLQLNSSNRFIIEKDPNFDPDQRVVSDMGSELRTLSQQKLKRDTIIRLNSRQGLEKDGRRGGVFIAIDK